MPRIDDHVLTVEVVEVVEVQGSEYAIVVGDVLALSVCGRRQCQQDYSRFYFDVVAGSHSRSSNFV